MKWLIAASAMIGTAALIVACQNDECGVPWGKTDSPQTADQEHPNATPATTEHPSEPPAAEHPTPPPPPSIPQPPATLSGQHESPSSAFLVKDLALGATDDSGFADNAFPPTLTDTDVHRDAWLIDDCLRCHETGVGNAPVVHHAGMPGILLTAKCRSCHVVSPGKVQPEVLPEASIFDDNAFPPMMPNTEDHKAAWGNNDCLLCHQDGNRGAPKVMHKGMPRILLKAKCRSCHVQIRSTETSPWDK